MPEARAISKKIIAMAKVEAPSAKELIDGRDGNESTKRVRKFWEIKKWKEQTLRGFAFK
jgi:hypothetical protein